MFEPREYAPEERARLRSEVAGQSLHELPGHVSDQVEVLVDMQDRHSSSFGHRGDQKIGDLGCSVVAALGQ